jgi:hypothetical protein
MLHISADRIEYYAEMKANGVLDGGWLRYI